MAKVTITISDETDVINFDFDPPVEDVEEKTQAQLVGLLLVNTIQNLMKEEEQ